MIEARRAHLLRRGLRHGPDELAVRIEDLDRIRMVAAVGMELHRVGCGLGDETVPLGARLCRNAGKIAAPGSNQTDAVLKAVIALLFHADHRIGQQHHARRVALQRDDPRLRRRERHRKQHAKQRTKERRRPADPMFHRIHHPFRVQLYFCIQNNYTLCCAKFAAFSRKMFVFREHNM